VLKLWDFFFELGDNLSPWKLLQLKFTGVAGKENRLPLTAALENFAPMRRLGNGKYDNQQRLGLGGKGCDGGRLVVAVDGTGTAASGAQVQTVAVKGVAVQHQW
jgi:hypothetical protein